MRRITAILALVALTATKATAQSTAQKTNWDPTTSYVVGGLVTTFGYYLKSKWANIEITPLIGPSSNWMRYDDDMINFFNQNGVTPGKLHGFSAGYLIGARLGFDGLPIVRTGVFFDSKGHSFSSDNAQGQSRLNYLTIPVLVGLESDRDNKLIASVCTGPFFGLPVSEKHLMTHNGKTEEIKPLETIGADIGIVTDISLEYEIKYDIFFNIGFRYQAGMTQTEKLIGEANTRSAQILVGLKMFTDRNGKIF
jgi:hypothetical protein